MANRTTPRNAFETYIADRGAIIWEGEKTGRYFTDCDDDLEWEALTSAEVIAENAARDAAKNDARRAAYGPTAH